MSGREDAPLTLVMNERTLSSVKADLAHTFLSVRLCLVIALMKAFNMQLPDYRLSWYEEFIF